MYGFLQGRLVIVRIILMLAAGALVAIGIVTIYSVGHPAETGSVGNIDDLTKHWQKQIVFATIGAVGFLLVNLINYRRFGAWSYRLYGFVLVLLALLLVDKYITDVSIGNFLSIPVINGTRRWITFQIAGRDLPALQPSEFCKLIYILALAWYLRYRSNYRHFRGLIGPFMLTLLPMILILREPDLGTVLLMMPILFTMLFVAGAKVKHLFIIVLLALAISPLLWVKMDHYQRIRISSVILQNQKMQEKAKEHPKLAKVLVGTKFDERQWKNEWGYHLIRSKYAVASGGATGYGFRKGPFIKYNFLPARHNDFIFAAIAHQWGFGGCVTILALYVIIIACGLEVAGNNTDPFARLVAVGIVSMFTVEVIVNISMTLGLMPITGLTLPLVSYGGSSLLVSMLAIGLLNNVGRCRPFTLAAKK